MRHKNLISSRNVNYIKINRLRYTHRRNSSIMVAQVILFPILLLACSFLSYAQDKPRNFRFFYAKDLDGTPQVNLHKREFSIKNADTYCWLANVPIDVISESPQHIQKFTMPAAGEVSLRRADGSVEIIENEHHTSWSIHTNFNLLQLIKQKNIIFECWITNPDDPIGQYTLEVTIGNYPQPAVEFYVVE